MISILPPPCFSAGRRFSWWCESCMVFYTPLHLCLVDWDQTQMTSSNTSWDLWFMALIFTQIRMMSSLQSTTSLLLCVCLKNKRILLYHHLRMGCCSFPWCSRCSPCVWRPVGFPTENNGRDSKYVNLKGVWLVRWVLHLCHGLSFPASYQLSCWTCTNTAPAKGFIFTLIDFWVRYLTVSLIPTDCLPY